MIATALLPTRSDIAAAQVRYHHPFAVDTIAYRNRNAGPIKVGAPFQVTDEVVLDIRKGPL